MWTKKSKIIYCIILILLVLFGVKYFNDKKKDSIRFVGHYDNLYYGISYNNSSYVEKFSDLELVIYNSNSKEKIKYDLENIRENVIIEINSLKSFDNWILMQGANSASIYGIDINTGKVKELVQPDKKYSIRTYALSENKIAYTTLISTNSTSNNSYNISVKDIDTNEIINLGTFDSVADIPVSIYENKITYLIDNKITVVDIYDKNTITSLPNYSGNSLIYKDNIYTFRTDTGSFIKLDLSLNEEEILKNANISNSLYIDSNKVVSSNYFYDTEKEKLYLRKIGASWSYNKAILGDYIYSINGEYEPLEENLNYYEYKLKGDMFVGNSKYIDSTTIVKVLTSGEVVVTPVDSNEIFKSNSGFTKADKYLLWDFAYNNNKIYSIEGSDTSLLSLVSIDIDTGEKELIKEINEPIENIKQIASYGNEVGYLTQSNTENIFTLINLDSKEETSLKLDLRTEAREILFNERYVAVLCTDSGVVRIFGKYTGNILAASKEEYLDLLGITQDNIVVSSSSDYQVLDLTLKKIKDYSNHDKVLKFLYN